jgi:hypothetical protein
VRNQFRQIIVPPVSMLHCDAKIEKVIHTSVIRAIFADSSPGELPSSGTDVIFISSISSRGSPTWQTSLLCLALWLRPAVHFPAIDDDVIKPCRPSFLLLMGISLACSVWDCIWALQRLRSLLHSKRQLVEYSVGHDVFAHAPSLSNINQTPQVFTFVVLIPS